MGVNKHDSSILKILGDFVIALVVGGLSLLALTGIIGSIWALLFGNI